MEENHRAQHQQGEPATTHLGRILDNEHILRHATIPQPRQLQTIQPSQMHATAHQLCLNPKKVQQMRVSVLPQRMKQDGQSKKNSHPTSAVQTKPEDGQVPEELPGTQDSGHLRAGRLYLITQDIASTQEGLATM